MKQFVISLMVVLMSMMASTPCSAKTATKSVKKQVPTNIVVKQTTCFNDGRTLILYYKKSGAKCEVYSPCDVNDFNVNDASKIKSTNFEVVDKVEGKLYRKASVDEVTKIIKKLVHQYL
ncbi:MAG: hypothetical protein IK067_00490 [Prevotella sp.]|nr:hypothetical protein [Prevotella sp.]